MSTTQITLWFIRETADARLYSKTDPEDKNRVSDPIWVPKSVIEHTSKTGNQHIVTLADWWVEKSGL
jgi:hypothetical protein